MIYLYGLQRSGTNVLTEFLEKNYPIKIVKNYKDRTHAQHKHFRIYDNKKLAPEGFNNTHIINSISDLDNKLGDTRNSNKYIVIYKDIYSWLPSIKKWALKCKWAKKQTTDFIDDYFEFIDKWNSLANERVLLINYDDYLNLTIGKENNDLINRVELFLKVTKKLPKLIFPNEVILSEKFSPKRLEYYTNKEYMKSYTEDEIKLIEERLKTRSVE